MKLHNRQIKSSFWTDSGLLQWPRDKRWFYMGLVQLADDSGCLENSSFAFKIQLFPSPVDADITTEVINEWRDELVSAGKLIPYRVANKECLYVRNFHKHQTLKNCPAPDVPLPEWIKWEGYASNNRSGKYIVNEDALTKFLQSSYNTLADILQPSSNLTKPNLTKPNKTYVCPPAPDCVFGKNGDSETDEEHFEHPSNDGENVDDCHDAITDIQDMAQEIVDDAQDIIPDTPETELEVDAQTSCPGNVNKPTEKYSADFKAFWQIYPRKIEKRKAWRAWKKRIQERAGPELIRAAKKYAETCRGTEIRYVKHAATFLGPDKPYEEYLTEGDGEHNESTSSAEENYIIRPEQKRDYTSGLPGFPN